MTPAVRPNDVVIARLRLKAPADEIAGLRRELDQAAWPVCADPAWIFIRQVRAAAPRNHLVAAVLRQTRRWTDGGADQDQVVRFSHLDELLAHLLADLAAGTASGHWYWRRWSHLFALSPRQAVARLLTEALERLAAVTAWSARLGNLARVWHTLTPEDAGGLAQALAGRNGLKLPRLPLAVARAEPNLAPVVLPTALGEQWRATLAPLPREDLRRLPALLLMAQEVAPLALAQAPTRVLADLDRAFGPSDPSAFLGPATVVARAQVPAAQLSETWRARSRQAAEGSAAASDSAPIAPGEATPAAETLRPKPIIAKSAQVVPEGRIGDAAGSVGAPTGGQARPAPAATRAAEKRAPRHPGSNAGHPSEFLPSAGDTSRPHPRVGLTAGPGTAPRECFETRQGGLFYLLNFLNRQEARAAVTAVDPVALPQSGWALLYRLGQELALDESDPVAAFLAGQMGLDGAALAQVPALPAREQLLALARQWYGRAGLWQPELLALAARVHFTPSHVDLFASLASVRLPVRLAGLDIDPGWLPWLGRVVSFHYEARQGE